MDYPARAAPGVGFVYDPVCLNHDTGTHPENARRLVAVLDHLRATRTTEKLIALKARPATGEELGLVHQSQHVQRIYETASDGGGYLDADTPVSPGSYEAALYAAGGAIAATEAVLKREITTAFALVRPPGHHATPDAAMGFCLFNNIAIAARWATQNGGVRRIAIIDCDVHHGNGTQAVFESDSAVLYVSTHQSPLYPGTGGINETGSGDARGTKINIPLPPGSGDAEYRRVYEEIIVPAVRRFRPELILVSAGYDAHYRETLAQLRLTVTGYAFIIKTIRELAGELCGGRLVLTLEGGYNLPALAASVRATFDSLLGADKVVDPFGPPPDGFRPADITALLQRIKQIHCLA
jgi:acetoin utilization deacetylase AcuC-like enzyme